MTKPLRPLRPQIVGMAENNIQIETHPPYSSDLDPIDVSIDLHLVMQQLKGKQFQSDEEARAFFEGAILPLPHSAW